MEFLEMQRMLCSNPLTKIVEIYNVSGSEVLANCGGVKSKSNPLLKALIDVVPKWDKMGLARGESGGKCAHCVHVCTA